MCQSAWVRYGAVGFVCSAAKFMDEIDTACYLSPKVEPFLQYPVIQLKDKVR